MQTLKELADKGVKFATINIDETLAWSDEVRAQANNAPILCVYCVNLTEPTHLCEITVSYPAEWLQNFVTNTEGIDENELAEIEYRNDTDPCYFQERNRYEVTREDSDAESFEDYLENERANPSVC